MTIRLYMNKDMILLKRLLLGTIFCSVWVQTSFAQQDSTLTYEQAVEIAVSENIQIKQQQNLLKINEATRAQAYAQFLPSAGINIGAQRRYGIFFDEGAGTLVNVKTDGLNGFIGASYPIFTGFSRFNQVKQAQNALEAQHHQIDQTKQQVIFDVSQQYLEVLLNQELLRISRANLEQQEELLQSITIFVETGTRNIADQYNQEAETKRVALTVVEAENSLAISKAKLIRILQIDPFRAWRFAEPDVEQWELLADEINLKEVYNQAIKNRPDIKQQQNLIKAGEYGVKAAKGNFYPYLSLDYNYGSGYSSNVNLDFLEQITSYGKAHAISASLYIPIFNNLETKTLVQRSRQLLHNTELDLEDLERNTLEQLQTVAADYRAAQQRIVAAEAQVKAAAKAVEAEKERFRLGVGNVLDLNRVNALYIEALAKKAQADYTLIFQKTAMDYYTGTLQTEDFNAE